MFSYPTSSWLTSVTRGLALAKECKYDSALKCYQHALEIDSTFLDAFIATGAVYSSQLLIDCVAKKSIALPLSPLVVLSFELCA